MDILEPENCLRNNNNKESQYAHGYPSRLEAQTKVRETYETANRKTDEDGSCGEFWLCAGRGLGDKALKDMSEFRY